MALFKSAGLALIAEQLLVVDAAQLGRTVLALFVLNGPLEAAPMPARWTLLPLVRNLDHQVPAHFARLVPQLRDAHGTPFAKMPLIRDANHQIPALVARLVLNEAAHEPSLSVDVPARDA